MAARSVYPTGMNFQLALAQAGGYKVKMGVRTGDYFPFGGGLDVMDPPLAIAPGQLLGVNNYEPAIIGGYRRFDGYERFSGQLSPSTTPFISIPYTSSGGFTPAEGATVTESGSGATGTVTYLDTVNLAVVLLVTSGTFVGAGSTLTSGAQTAVSSGKPILNGGANVTLSNSYFYQNYLYLQSLIGPVGGAACSGPVNGVCPYGTTVYAFRNNAAGTAGLMFKATSTGWVQVALGFKVRFNAGVYSSSMQQPLDGTVLTGATSGATFTIQRTGTLSGTWGTDAAGYFIASAITGTPVADELLKNGTTTIATYLSSAAQTLPPGGIYSFRLHDFNYAQVPTAGFRMYGVNQVGNGFEYDAVGGVFTLIETGMSPDVPMYLEIHANYLFYGFAQGSLQNSGYQLPMSWNPVFGADARSVGEPITFMREDVSQTLIIGTRRSIWYLTGIQVEQFQILPLTTNTGAISLTDESLGQMIFGEDRGFTTLAAAQQYGDFEGQSLSDKILKLITSQLANDTPIGAFVTRRKNLYRLVFASGQVYCLGMNAQGAFTGWTTGFWVHPPTCVMDGFVGSTPQVERMFFGSSNGYVYEIDKGRSFDGQVVSHFLKTAYWHSKSPDVFKRYRKVSIDVAPEGQASVIIGADTDYGSRTGQTGNALSLAGGGGYWDVAVWDQFAWDNPVYQQTALKLELEGFNISLTFSGSAVNDVPFTVSGASYQESLRIINRNTSGA